MSEDFNRGEDELYEEPEEQGDPFVGEDEEGDNTGHLEVLAKGRGKPTA